MSKFHETMQFWSWLTYRKGCVWNSRYFLRNSGNYLFLNKSSSVSKTGVGATLPGVQIPLSPPLYQWLISRLPALLFLNRTIVEYSWRVRSSLFSVRYCDIQHLIRYGSDRKLSSENVQLFSRFLIAHHYSFRHSSYETAAKLVVGTEVA